VKRIAFSAQKFIGLSSMVVHACNSSYTGESLEPEVLDQPEQQSETSSPLKKKKSYFQSCSF
jgi:hypothetical protein